MCVERTWGFNKREMQDAECRVPVQPDKIAFCDLSSAQVIVICLIFTLILEEFPGCSIYSPVTRWCVEVRP
jgi:hypothetical protein